MKFARIVFGIAAAYGFVLLLSMYFLMDRIGRDNPPLITHPEFYYGFVGVTLLWQVVFVLIAVQPERYRPLMVVAIFEKVVYVLHAFKKKSRKGIATPKLEIDLIKRRLTRAREDYERWQENQKSR